MEMYQVETQCSEQNQDMCSHRDQNGHRNGDAIRVCGAAVVCRVGRDPTEKGRDHFECVVNVECVPIGARDGKSAGWVGCRATATCSALRVSYRL